MSLNLVVNLNYHSNTHYDVQIWSVNCIDSVTCCSVLYYGEYKYLTKYLLQSIILWFDFYRVIRVLSILRTPLRYQQQISVPTKTRLSKNNLHCTLIIFKADVVLHRKQFNSLALEYVCLTRNLMQNQKLKYNKADIHSSIHPSIYPFILFAQWVNNIHKYRYWGNRDSTNSSESSFVPSFLNSLSYSFSCPLFSTLTFPLISDSPVSPVFLIIHRLSFQHSRSTKSGVCWRENCPALSPSQIMQKHRPSRILATNVPISLLYRRSKFKKCGFIRKCANTRQRLG